MSRTDTQRVRENILDDAIRAGRIAASDRDRYARLYDADPRVTRQLLTAKVEEGGLMPGLVGPGEDPTTAADPSGYDAGWLSPIERQRIAQAGGPSPAPSPAPAPAPSPAPAVPLGEVGVSAEVPASPPRAQAQRASVPGAEHSGDEYPGMALGRGARAHYGDEGGPLHARPRSVRRGSLSTMSALLDTREGRIVVRTRLYRRLAAEQEYMDVGVKEDVGDRIDATSPDLALWTGSRSRTRRRSTS